MEHRLHRGKEVEGEGYVRMVEDRKLLPLVDESSASKLKTKNQITDEVAVAEIDSWKKRIAEWKKKPDEQRPIGYSSKKGYHRGNKELSEKSLTGRETSKISTLSPSWRLDLKPIERLADQAWFELNVYGEPLTRENMLKQMLYLNEWGRELVSAKVLEGIYFDINPAEKGKLEKEPEGPKTGILTEREQKMISRIIYEAYEVKGVMQEFGLRGVKSIVKTVDGQFIMKYDHVTPEEIHAYVNSLEFPTPKD